MRLRPPHRLRPALLVVRHAVRVSRGAASGRSTRCSREVERYGCPLVEVTGGEPLLQEDVYPLMEALLDRGKTVLLETGGHRSTARVPAERRHDPRREVPGQRRSRNATTGTNLERLRPHDEVKFVIKDRADYEYARDVIARHDAGRPRGGHPLLAGARRARSADARRSGCSPIACRCASSCSSTSTSGAPTRAASEVEGLTSHDADAVVLLSGGLDSYTAAAIARADGFRLYALTVRYGQRHARELEARAPSRRGSASARHVELDVGPVARSAARR